MDLTQDAPQATRNSGEAGQLVGVILAAGRGKRIAPLNAEFPKPLLPVLDKPIMAWQIEEMARIGIRQVFIVIGHLGQKIRDALGDGQAWGVEITYVEQEDPQGIAHALLTLEELVQVPLLVFLGDILLRFRDLHLAASRLATPGVDSVLVVKHEPVREYIMRNFAVTVNEDGRVTRVIEKPKHPPNDLKGCGVYFFKPTFFDALRRTPRSIMRNEYEITDAIQIFIDDGYRVEVADIVEWDMNMTFPADLLECNLRMLREHGMQNSISPQADIAAGCVIENSIIGAGARVVYPIAIRHSLIWSGAVVDIQGELDHAIVTPELVLSAVGQS
ncbi:MAG: NTP transferase domain-containing protein [Chloroflexi bacterium]|nr:NTP transferase domain-containing protein [Chloroflexota bacterium]